VQCHAFLDSCSVVLLPEQRVTVKVEVEAEAEVKRAQN
jgi:hypothetical protein